MNLPFRSVDTPVENKPRDATAKDPPRSTKGKLVLRHYLGFARSEKLTHACNSTSMEDVQAVL